MKRIVYLLPLLAIGSTAVSQGFIKKLKDKATNAIDGNKTTAANNTAGGSNIAYADPAQYGQPIYQLQKNQAMIGDGMIPLSLESADVAGGDLHARMNINSMWYEYSNGQLKATGQPYVQHSGYQFMRNEKDLQCVDMSNQVQSDYLVKKDPRICSGPIRGQVNQTYTFNGKLVASGMCSVLRNYDSSAIVLVGSSFTPGHVEYFVMTSLSQKLVLPTICQPGLISPNGKIGAAMHQTGMGGDYLLTDGRKISISKFPGGDHKLWIRNSGNIFVMDYDSKHLLRNDQPFLDLSDPNLNFNEINLFISEDEKMVCWFGGYTGVLHFSDGTTFENSFGAQRVWLNNKETMVFLAGSVKDNKLYLCRKEL